MENVKIELLNEGEDLKKVKKLINKFQEKNNLNFKITILIDWNTKNVGYFFYGERKKKIYVNPKQCEFNEKTFGYTDDYSMTGTLIHEFAHCLDEMYEIHGEYISYVQQNGRLILNKYVRESDLGEEVAELVCLYINNPYFLKLIDPDRYKWIKNFFKTPTTCSLKKFLKIREDWSNSIKKLCWKEWGIKTLKQNIYFGRRFYIVKDKKS